jgi:hypothetical protein
VSMYVVHIRAVGTNGRLYDIHTSDVKYWMWGAISHETFLQNQKKKQKQEFNRTDSLVLHGSEKDGR